MNEYMHVHFFTNFTFFCILTEKISNYSMSILSLSYFTINSPYRLIKLQQIENLFLVRRKCFIKTQFFDKTQKMCKMYLFGNGWLLIQLKSFLGKTSFLFILNHELILKKKNWQIYLFCISQLEILEWDIKWKGHFSITVIYFHYQTIMPQDKDKCAMVFVSVISFLSIFKLLGKLSLYILHFQF